MHLVDGDGDGADGVIFEVNKYLFDYFCFLQFLLLAYNLEFRVLDFLFGCIVHVKNRLTTGNS